MAWLEARQWKVCGLEAHNMRTVGGAATALDAEATTCMERPCVDEEVVGGLGVATVHLADAVVVPVHHVQLHPRAEVHADRVAQLVELGPLPVPARHRRQSAT